MMYNLQHSTRQAGDILGVSSETVRRLFYAGRIGGEWVNQRRIRITENDIFEFLQHDAKFLARFLRTTPKDKFLASRHKAIKERLCLDV